MADLKPKVLSANGADKLLDDGDNLVLVKAPSADTHGVNKKYVDDADTAIETELQGNIDAEEAARIAADNQLQAAIDAEEAARISADIQLQDNLDAETAFREGEDANLQEQIDAITGGSLDGKYVERAGDDMTGTLTFNTNKIILDKDGAGTFAGALEAASIDGGSYQNIKRIITPQ